MIDYKNNFAVMILSYGRPEKQYTYKTIRDKGYNGKIYIVCDDKDKSLKKYIEIYKDEVLVFSKDKYKKTFDKCDNFENDKSVIYARNAVYDLASEKGLKYICVVDDDYSEFQYRVDKNYKYKAKAITKNISDIFEIFLEYLIKSKIKTICFSQGGDFIGGSENADFAIKKNIKRKAMNLYFFDVDNPMYFVSKLNDDLTTSVFEGVKGELLFTCPLVSLVQKETQQNSGGLTDIYLDYGTYVKSFYSVMYYPAAVKISTMGRTNHRFHHKVKWNNVCPKIIRE
jgi:hypothetical protein